MELSYVSGVALSGPRVAWQSGERFAVDSDGDVYLIREGVSLRLATLEGRRFRGHAQYDERGQEIYHPEQPRLPGLRLGAPGQDVLVEVGSEPVRGSSWAGLAVQRGRLVVLDQEERVLAECVDGSWRRPGVAEEHWAVTFAALPEFRPLRAHPRQRLSPLAAQDAAGNERPVNS